LRNWLAAFLALSCSLSSWSDPEIIEYQIADDGWVEVPLDFTFPFYGNSYVTSFMFSNGVVGFLNPLTVDGTGYIHDGLCCNGEDFTNGATGVRFNYTIMPWHTDLIDTGLGRFYTQGDSTYQKYMWENLAEYRYPDRENSFDLTIYPLGNIAMNYTEMAINNHSVTVATIGDLSAGEYKQWFYNHPTDGAIYWNNQEDDPIAIAEGESICSVIPDSHITCLYYPETYANNYYNQQCGLNPLYDYGCTGYDYAYLIQQCDLNTLYNESCEGWDDAYYEEYVEEDEPDVWEEEEEEIEIFIPIDIPTYIEINTVPIEINIPMLEEFELQLPEFEMEEFSQETIMAEIEAEIEEYFDPLPEPEPVEELEEPIEEQLDEPEPEEDSVSEEQEPEEQEQEEIEDEPREDEELEESTNEELEESPEETEELEEVAPEPEVVEEKVEEKKKESKKDKMREIISNKLQNLAMEMGEASSLEEQQKLQSLILALLNFNSEFSNYNSQLADSIFYESKDIYTGRQIPDSQKGLRNGLANEILHNKLVDLQWQN